MNEVSSLSAQKSEDLDLSLVWNFFSNVPEKYKEELGLAFEYIRLNANERLIQQGELGDSLYIVLDGQLRVIDEELDEVEQLLSFKDPGDAVGEIALLTGERRTASVDAVVETGVVSLSRSRLRRVAKDTPEANDVVYDAIRQRVQQSRLNHVLIRTNIFKNLEEPILKDVQAELELMTVASGDTIMKVGDLGDELFIVIGGRLRVVSPTPDQKSSYIVDTHVGQTVGEIGLITGERRTATVFALRDSLLARLSKDAFQRLLQKHPEAMLAHFAGPIIERMRSQLSSGTSKTDFVTTICIIPVDDSVPITEFATKLTKSLHILGSTMHLNSSQCDALLDTQNIAYLHADDPKNDQFVFWLNEQEASHDTIVYEADTTSTAWTRRCIRQADLVLIVGNANGTFALNDIETSLLQEADNQQIIQCLVLLHDNDVSLPHNTALRLLKRNVRNYYHVRLHQDSDFRRMSRLLTGNGVGLVLGGGGARALSHIGVIQALVERGIPIDVVSGVSGGAIVAGLWAMGLDIETMIQMSQQAIKRIDYTFPFHALTTGRNWTNALMNLFGDVHIENLWTSFYCVSANLSQARVRVHESGSLMHAIRASTAIPGILPPVYDRGNILVDGGLINNLPADIMRERREIGRVIAVDVGAADETKEIAPFGYTVSGWRSLWSRLSPWGRNPRNPSIGDVMLRSISLTNARTVAKANRLVDFYLAPPVQEFGLMDFDKISTLVDLGYQYTMETHGYPDKLYSY